MKVEIRIIESRCRSHYHKAGDTFVVDDLCPPLCSELWYGIYPNVCVLQNGGTLDYGESKGKVFRYKCPDEGRVLIEGYVIKD
jgi:uncharacterized repeat protein (TIGR04076 family)